MTHVEALKLVLEELGGRAQLKEIYPRVVKLISFKEGSNIQATLRTSLQRHPKFFRQSEGKPDGWWELVSYQQEIAELKEQVAGLKEENRLLKAVPKEVEFIEKFIHEVMNVYKHDRKKADSIRIIMRTLSHEDAAAVLDAWIDEKEDELAKALERLNIHIRNITMTGQNATYNENNK
jgi:hypothetical protein